MTTGIMALVCYADEGSTIRMTSFLMQNRRALLDGAVLSFHSYNTFVQRGGSEYEKNISA